MLGTCVILKPKVCATSFLESWLGFLLTSIKCVLDSLLLFLGIWVWGSPVEVDIGGVKTSIFYLDTEGFESVGKSNVYDDR